MNLACKSDTTCGPIGVFNFEIVQQHSDKGSDRETRISNIVTIQRAPFTPEDPTDQPRVDWGVEASPLHAPSSYFVVYLVSLSVWNVVRTLLPDWTNSRRVMYVKWLRSGKKGGGRGGRKKAC